MFAQQCGGVLLPRHAGMVSVLQGLQTLHIAGEHGTNVADGIGRIALDAVLHLAHFVATRQPDQGAQHGKHQKHQQRPQHAPTRRMADGQRHHSTFVTRGLAQVPSTRNSLVPARINGLLSTICAK